MQDFIMNLPVYPIPARYKWRNKEAVSLADIGFPHICDCLHKSYATDVEPFPEDFDEDLWKRKRVKLYTNTFIKINPEKFIMAQRYLDKKRLLQVLDEGNPQQTRMTQVGDYTIIHDGHHRTALRFLKDRRVYARVKVLY